MPIAWPGSQASITAGQGVSRVPETADQAIIRDICQ
jgi:hypothetical protein